MSSVSQAEELKEASQLFLREGRCPDAIRICELWIEAHSEDPWGYYTRGKFYDLARQPALALLFYVRAGDLGLDGPINRFLRGHCLKEIGRIDDAVGEFERVIELDLRDRQLAYAPHLMMAECHRMKQRVGKAIECCDRVPDAFSLPGFHGLLNGSKFTVLDRIARAPFEDSANSAHRPSGSCGCGQ